ncbi:hypothetical protein D9758_005597 [Tetrapyrgos nigripes]|uniref:Uncharacterized protein n=1 Tax=Tetrapyrgos nigripes TaxID=182062 RepID=A0A8H5GH14_9AGAR|nr:hypothetical protein D9758_005597 [Tetrapyrgos nigripes]
MNTHSSSQSHNQNMDGHQEPLPIPAYLPPTHDNEELADDEQHAYQEYQTIESDGNTLNPGPGQPELDESESWRSTGLESAEPTRGPPADTISLHPYPAPHAADAHHFSVFLQVEAHRNGVNANPVQLSAVLQAGNAVMPYGQPQLQTSRARRVNVILNTFPGRIAQLPPQMPRQCPMCRRPIPCRHIPY